MSNASWFVAFDAPLALEAPAVPTMVRRIDPRDFHATVAFFGACGEKRAIKGWTQLERDSSLPLVFEAQTDGCSLFGGKTPRAIAVELTSAPLMLWMEQVRPRLLTAANAAPDTRKIRPHITVARIKHKANEQERHEAQQWMEQLEVRETSLVLSTLALFTWNESTAGPRYKRVRSLQLER